MKLKNRIERSYRVREGYWFAQKRFGFGATPVTWQGWLTTIAFAVLFLAAFRLLPTLPMRLAVVVPLTIGFVVLANRKTDGGWQWHWGWKD